MVQIIDDNDSGDTHNYGRNHDPITATFPLLNSSAACNFGVIHSKTLNRTLTRYPVNDAASANANPHTLPGCVPRPVADSTVQLKLTALSLVSGDKRNTGKVRTQRIDYCVSINRLELGTSCFGTFLTQAPAAPLSGKCQPLSSLATETTPRWRYHRFAETAGRNLLQVF